MKSNLLCIATLLLVPNYALHASDAAKPNILFILTDDQGYGDVARHGHPLLKTPNIDALHDQSVRFENFHVSPSCSPARAALMTGMHEFRNGVTHTTLPREHLNKDSVLLPQLLKSAVYRTGFIGKWHLGNDGDYAPDKRGFDWCSTNIGGPGVHFDPVIVRNRKREPRKGYRAGVKLAASHKYAMASVRSGDHLLVRSHPCDDPACESFSSQCTTRRSVEKGATRATYTEDNAQFHWGVTPRGRWSLYNLKTDAGCIKDLASQEPELTAKLPAAYEPWWNSVYPEMIRLGGDKGDPGTKP
jgi:hypothetical protein